MFLTPSAWLAIAMICASGAITPGPSLAVVVRNTVAGGRRLGVATALAHASGVGLYAFAAVAGFSAVVQAVPQLQQLIGACGAVFLIWTGVRGLRQGARDAHPSSSSRGRAWDGFLIAFLNPKIAVFFLALLSAMVPVQSTLLERTGVAALAMGIDGAWYALVAVGLEALGVSAWLGRHAALLERTTGMLLLGVGMMMLVRLLV